MDHTFPSGFSPTEIAWQTVILHVALLILVVASIAGLFLSRRGPASTREIAGWGFVILLAPVWGLVSREVVSEYVRPTTTPFVVGYVLFVWTVCGIGMFRAHRAMKKQGERSRIGIVVSALVSLGLLIMYSLPMVPTAREAARRSTCKNNLKQIMLAIHDYADADGHWPQASTGKPPVSWRVRLLPLINRANLFEKYDQSRTWDDSGNSPVAETRIDMLTCPSRRFPVDGQDEAGRWLTDYVMVTGPGTASSEQRRVTLEDFKDGAAYTIAITEASGLNIAWTEPRDFDVSREPIGANLSGKERGHSPGILSSYHRGGAQVGFANGKVRFISENIDPSVLRALTTIDAGDAIPKY